MFPKSTNLADGFEKVSYQRLANAVNRICWVAQSHDSLELRTERILLDSLVPPISDILYFSSPHGRLDESYVENSALSSQFSSQAALGPLRFAKKYGGSLTISLREIQLQEYHFMPISRSNAAKYVECGSPYPQGASTDIAHHPRCRLCPSITLMM
jgi:hypothetical protein